MASYTPELTLLDARTKHFAANDFGVDGGYNAAWVKVKYYWLTFYFPNTKARRRIVGYHDLHHVLTEYDTDIPGECEISAWEIGTGSTRNYVAWILNLLGFGYGFLIYPRRVYRAFMRGRHSLNLYSFPIGDELLAEKVGRMRRILQLEDDEIEATSEDRKAFAFWGLAAFATYMAFALMLFAPVIALLALWIFR